MRILGLLALAAGLLIFLYFEAYGVDPERNTAVVARLLELKQLEATLNQDVLRSRYNLLHDYRTLDATISREHELLDELRFGRTAITGMWGGVLEGKVEDYARLHALRTKLAWQFESSNSVLRRLADRLPPLASEVERKLRQSGSDPDLLELVHIIQDGAFLYIAKGGSAARNELDGWIDQLELDVVGRPEQSVPEVKDFVSGARGLIAYKTELDGFVGQIFSLDAGQAIDDLHLAYVSAYQKAQDRSDTYRRLMFFFAGVMLCYIGYILLRLRRSASARIAANERLQAQALQLEASNRELEREVDERQRAEMDMVRAKESAEHANRAKSEFLANMSHELRTPLNAIIGFSEIMREQMFGPLGHESYVNYTRHIHESGHHLLSVINDILDLSKIEAGRFTISNEVVDLGQVIRSGVQILEERARAGRLALVVDIPEALPQLRGDSRALLQVLLNLLSNAVKFTQPGGRITVRGGVGLAKDPFISVTDTGIGIAAEDMVRAMEPFGQVETALTRRHQGTGLGLPLARKLVEAHGGTLEIQSKPNVGTIATLRFPAERVVAQRGTAAA